MSGRILTNLAGFQNRTLTGLSSINTAETDIEEIKTKYDFGATVDFRNFLVGDANGNYESTTFTNTKNAIYSGITAGFPIAS